MAEDKNYTNNTERPREDEELEIDQIVLAIVHDGQNIILSAGWQTTVQFVHGVMGQPFK